MKYIMVQARLCKRNEDDMTVLIPVTFSKVLVHSDMYEAVYHNLARDDDRDFGDIQCVGAGFVDSALGGYKCYGESESLKIASRGDLDSDVMNQMRYAHGFSYLQTVESTVEEFFSPLGFMLPQLKVTDHADMLLAATADATKAAYELRTLHSNGFALGGIVRGCSTAKGESLTMPAGLRFDYVGPISTINFNGLSHMIRLAGTHELVEIPDSAVCYMLPSAMTVNRSLALLSNKTLFDFGKVIKDLDVVVTFDEGHVMAGKPADKPEHIGFVSLKEIRMQRPQQDVMLSGEGFAHAQFHVVMENGKVGFVVTMRMRDFHQRAEKFVKG
jgi:hypothetical protein